MKWIGAWIIVRLGCRLTAFAAVGTIGSVMIMGEASAQIPFEGVATFVTRRLLPPAPVPSPEDRPIRVDTVLQTTKGGNLRLEGFPELNRGGAFIVDVRGRTIAVTARDTSVYVSLPEDQERIRAIVKDAVARGTTPSGAGNPRPPKITRTGRRESVGGVPCEVYRVVADSAGREVETDACVGDIGLEIFRALSAEPVAAIAEAEWDYLRGTVEKGRALVKVTSREDGKPFVSLELLSVQPRSVPDAAFEPPAGFRIVTASDVARSAETAGTMMLLLGGVVRWWWAILLLAVSGSYLLVKWLRAR